MSADNSFQTHEPQGFPAQGTEKTSGYPNNDPALQMSPSESDEIVPLDKLRRVPQTIECPHCQKIALTRVMMQGEEKQKTWSIILGVLIFGCHIPKKLRWFEQTMWYCRECNKEVAKRKKDGPIQVLAKGD